MTIGGEVGVGSFPTSLRSALPDTDIVYNLGRDREVEGVDNVKSKKPTSSSSVDSNGLKIMFKQGLDPIPLSDKSCGSGLDSKWGVVEVVPRVPCLLE